MIENTLDAKIKRIPAKWCWVSRDKLKYRPKIIWKRSLETLWFYVGISKMMQKSNNHKIMQRKELIYCTTNRSGKSKKKIKFVASP